MKELIIVVGYRGDMIREHCGSVFHGRPVTYIEQKKLMVQQKALWLAKDLIGQLPLYVLLMIFMEG